MSVLQRIVARKREELAERRAAASAGDVIRRAADTPEPRCFRTALESRSGAAPAVIAEIKRRSPSKGELRSELDAEQLARTYAAAGAAALSVLTDRDFFGGSEADLTAAVAAASLPALRKDFTIDAYQVYEARVIGASAILLIMRVLDDAQVRELLSVARQCRLAALVEVHDADELERAAGCGADLIGVNNRNLDTFEVSLDTSLALRARMPAGALAVAESGIHAADDVHRLAAAGFDAILVGESLVRASDPGAKLRELLGGAG